MSQQILGTGPALIFLADQIGHRYPNVVEEHFVDFMLAVEGDDWSYSDARCLHVEQQEGNAPLLASLRVGAYQAEHPVGIVRQGGPGFLAVDHVVIVLAYGTGFQ
ncbi:hypothetical protein D3C76_951760 [compost metagenome]